MSSHPVRSRWLLVPTLLLAASAGASARGARAHIADASAIIPVMDVTPQVFPLASSNTAILSVTNGNTANAGILSTGDTFSFDFPNQGMNIGGPAQLTVNSPAISPYAWQGPGQNGGKAQLKNNGAHTHLCSRGPGTGKPEPDNANQTGPGEGAVCA